MLLMCSVLLGLESTALTRASTALGCMYMNTCEAFFTRFGRDGTAFSAFGFMQFISAMICLLRPSTIAVEQPEARMFVFNAGVDLNDIVRAVNQVGAAPGDLVAILEALKQAGALRAELIVI